MRRDHLTAAQVKQAVILQRRFDRLTVPRNMHIYSPIVLCIECAIYFISVLLPHLAARFIPCCASPGARIGQYLRRQLAGIHPNQTVTLSQGCQFRWSIADATLDALTLAMPPRDAWLTILVRPKVETRGSFCDLYGQGCINKDWIYPPTEIRVPGSPFPVYIPGELYLVLSKDFADKDGAVNSCITAPRHSSIDAAGTWAVTEYSGTAKQDARDFSCAVLEGWYKRIERFKKEGRPCLLDDWDNEECGKFREALAVCQRSGNVVMTEAIRYDPKTWKSFLHSLRQVYNGASMCKLGHRPYVKRGFELGVIFELMLLGKVVIP